MRDYLGVWLHDYAETNVTLCTLQQYRQMVGRMSEIIGDISLQALRPTDLQALYRTLLDGTESRRSLSPRTVVLYHRVLRSALQHAVRWQLIRANVSDAASPPRPHTQPMRALSSEEVHRLEQSCGDPELRTLIRFAVRTGMRIGEILGLRWSDVDFGHQAARVERTLHYLSGLGATFTSPKTARGRRTVALSAETLAFLRTHRDLQEERRRCTATAWEDYDLVFSGSHGQPIRASTLWRSYTRAIEAADLGKLRIHDLRHTAATLMLVAGVHPKVVSERLGHASITITLDTYSHVLPHLQVEAAAALEEILCPTTPQLGVADVPTRLP